MKLTGVDLDASGSVAPISLAFRDPTSTNPYIVKSIVGLDADTIIPKSYGGSAGAYNNMVLKDRIVVLKMGLNPNYSTNETYSDLRDALYRLISAGRFSSLQIRFVNGVSNIAALNGFVIKAETAQFEENQEFQLTVKCSDGMLRSQGEVTVDDIEDFEDIVVDDDVSTAPHGLGMTILIGGAMDSLIISDADGSEFEITPIGGFVTDDQVYVVSEHTGKQVYMLRALATIELGDVVQPWSIWPIIFPGENTFAISNPLDISAVDISYHQAWWGV